MRRCAVLILSGSSGRIETDRARLLAAQGAAVLPFQWFGGPGQPPEICEIPLETFAPALDRLAAASDNLAIIGTSRGAEAALLLAAHDPRVRAVAALAPTSVLWPFVTSGGGAEGATGGGPEGESGGGSGGGTGEGLEGGGGDHLYRSSWTLAGKPLPFVPFDETWIGGPESFRGIYEQSLRTFAERIEAATIPVEDIEGRVLLTAGTDDRLWPADRFAADIAARRAAHGLPTEVLIGAGAGHRVRLPGEPPIAPGRIGHGGSPEADAAFGARVWPRLLSFLNLA